MHSSRFPPVLEASIINLAGGTGVNVRKEDFCWSPQGMDIIFFFIGAFGISKNSPKP